MSEYEKNPSLERNQQLRQNFVDLVFDDSPFYYSPGYKGGVSAAIRSTGNIPVGEPNYEDYGVAFQPYITVEERKSYSFTSPPSLVGRLLGRIAVPDQQKRLEALVQDAQSDDHSVSIRYVARQITTSQISGFHDGLHLAFSFGPDYRAESPLLTCGLLHSEPGIPEVNAQHVEMYKQELSGITDASDEQLLAAIASHVTR